MAILESVRKLAEKLGAETNGRDITDQLNIINRHLDSTGSRDIAEAVSKFADKEDGIAILTTKSITENGIYAASDDGVSGYSSVSVDVSGDPLNFQHVDFAYDGFSSSGYTTMVSVVRNGLGLYDLTGGNVSGSMPPGTVSFRVKDDIVCIDQAVMIYVNVISSRSQTIIFTPSSEFEGIKSQYGSTLVAPSAVTPGDNKTYKYEIPASAESGTLTISTSNLTFDNNGYKIVK